MVVDVIKGGLTGKTEVLDKAQKIVDEANEAIKKAKAMLDGDEKWMLCLTNCVEECMDEDLKNEPL